MEELDDSGIDHSPVPGSGRRVEGDDSSRNNDDYDETSQPGYERDDGETMDGGGSSSYDGGGKYDIDDQDTNSPPGTARTSKNISYSSEFDVQSGSAQDLPLSRFDRDGGIGSSAPPSAGYQASGFTEGSPPPGFEQNWGVPSSHMMGSGPPGIGEEEDVQKHLEESVTSAPPQEVSNETITNGHPLSPQRQAQLPQQHQHQQQQQQQQQEQQPTLVQSAIQPVPSQPAQLAVNSIDSPGVVATTAAAAVQLSAIPQAQHQPQASQVMTPQLAMTVAQAVPVAALPATGVVAAAAPAISATPAATIDLSGEVWVEAKSGDGKSYFYNARTRETTWTKPEGNVKVILQEQLEVMAQQAAAAQSAGMMQAVPMTMPVQQAVVDDKQAAVADPSQAHAVGMIAGQMMAPPFGGPPPGFPGGPPPFGMPPPGFPGAFPGGYAPPPWGMGPAGTAPGMGPLPGLWSYNVPWQIDPEIMARAAEWTEHRAPDGRFYYYSAKSGESVWEKPQALKDLEAARVAASQGFQTTTSTVVSSISKQELMAQEAAAYVKKVKAAQAAAGEGGEDKPFSVEGKINGDLGVDSSSGAAVKKDEKKAETEGSSGSTTGSTSKPPQDKSKPVSSNPVPGTPWCVVWTGDSRVFFYNPSTRTSVWERPDDLIGRADVDKMVASPPTSGSGGSSDSSGTKRDASSSLKEDTTPSKKPKLDSSSSSDSKDDKTSNDRTGSLTTEKKAIDIGKEAAMEAEVRAAKERASVPLEVRIKSFREMLAEKEVSAFSTWEKELHKIVFDGRYLLLTSKERKQVFDKYVKERAEEERREKRSKMRERKEEFRRLMMDANLHGKSSFSDFASKHNKDERFKNIEKMRERESLFNEYILEVRKREKEEKAQKRDQIKRDFFSLLKESPDIDRHSRWSEVKKQLDSDPRYRAVDSSLQREDWFREFIKRLKEERKREKEMSRSKEERRERKERKERTSKSDEKRSKSKEPKESKERRLSVSGGDHDENEMEVDGPAEDDEELTKEREKQARVEASLREREKEVQRTLAVHLRDRDTEREHHKHEEAVQHFNALLADLVRNCELGWREAKRQLRKDHRSELASLLDRDEKEKLFNAHIEQLTLKKKEKFRELLNETPECSLSSSWKEVRKAIKDDPRYSKFSSSDRKCEREFKEYIKDKTVAAKADLRELLQETKLISHKSNGLVQENENHMREIEEILDKDKRWLVLAHLGEERRDLLKAYLVELEKRGPPPPPTACDPSRRPAAK